MAKADSTSHTSPDSQPAFVGIDVAKDELVVAYHDAKKACFTFTNNEQGIAQLINKLNQRPPSRIVFEPTGGYERLLALKLLEHELPLDLVNARRARDFAKSQGILAKTDRIDAKALAAFARSLEGTPRTIPNVDTIRVQSLLVRREQLVESRKQERNRSMQAIPEVRPSIKRVIEFLSAEIAAIEEELDTMIRDNATWHERAQALKAIDGIGEQTARTLVAFLPELGDLNRAEASALVGLAPFNCDSGHQRGKRHIYGGRARVRHTLYMAAMTATRTTSPWHAMYKRLRNAGKVHQVALIAIARKILLVANAVIKTGTHYDKKILLSTCPQT